ncbi:hypothetical protein TVAG_239020 [Trichomonas vaginalis G3]|uniref:Haloacid dehalogenase-like hydrolase family protein n=1 Tax=Trichomonas vaginalis (strain ATCC PRA-98 / G3) TaxID=412133 RepID=A2DGD3_TRIV3|nr:HAD-like family [Trichomonas vaginalis G3]EAY20529.1 hypothetical protein TVAG_239020 [Trichomonas vaginalis G3]KAI5488291.1 HAD-like family [Trichomonas vaginalis G3]|eukprot:XP_001581515.1 hypothetical protein [Trichomonas vaginalis G3]
MEKETLLIDCDGVLFPESALPIAKITQSLKNAALKIGYSAADIKEARKKAEKNQELGLFNSIWELSGKDIERFESICSEAFKTIDYSKIISNRKLYDLLKNASEYYNIFIATNNHLLHFRKVFERLFEMEFSDDCFITCIDITQTLDNGCFHPKQSIDGLKIFARVAKTRPEMCILLDDSSINIQRAKKINMKSMEIGLVQNLEFCLKELLSSQMSRIKV